MNAVVAIGGTHLFGVIHAYRTRIPSEVWVLGLKTPRDPADPLLRSLEALLEPFMDAYFAGQAQVKLAALAAHFTEHPLPCGPISAASASDAIVAGVGQGLASAMALVEMLDRAHVLAPIEIVVTDDSSVLARAAAAWARTRGLPAVTVLESVPLQRPWLPLAERTIVIGERARQAYGAIGIDAPRLLALPAPDASLHAIAAAERATRRTAGKAALSSVLGWAASDIVIVVDPGGRARDSALQAAAAFRLALSEIFAAFAVARASVPALRLAVITQPSADGFAWAGPAAAAAGIDAGDFAFAAADHALWIAGADIIVSTDSPRSFEAAEANVPALNLRGIQNDYDGAAFAAEDGVIDAAPDALAAMLAALAGDAALRAQIAAIAGDRIAGDCPTSAPATAAIAGELVKLRRLPPMTLKTPQPDIVIWAPDYDHSSGGIRALFRLCHLINLAGGHASMHAPAKLHPTWNAPRRDKPITDETIVIVPEIVFAHPSVKRIVRWVLNKPGLLGGPTTYGPHEMVFYYAQAFRAAAQAATAEELSAQRELEVFTLEPELFFNDRSRPRLYDCVYIGKGESLYARVQPREIRDALVIRRDRYVWPQSRDDTAALLRGCRYLYSFDAHTAITIEAVACGARAFYVRADGNLDEQLCHPLGFVQRYYDLSHVERFLALLHERHW